MSPWLATVGSDSCNRPLFVSLSKLFLSCARVLLRLQQSAVNSHVTLSSQNNLKQLLKSNSPLVRSHERIRTRRTTCGMLPPLSSPVCSRASTSLAPSPPCTGQWERAPRVLDLCQELTQLSANGTLPSLRKAPWTVPCHQSVKTSACPPLRSSSTSTTTATTTTVRGLATAKIEGWC